MQRVDVPAGLVDGAGGGDERLAGDLAPEDPLAVLVGLDPPEDVHLDRLEVEQLDQITQRLGHPAMLPRDRPFSAASGRAP